MDMGIMDRPDGVFVATLSESATLAAESNKSSGPTTGIGLELIIGLSGLALCALVIATGILVRYRKRRNTTDSFQTSLEKRVTRFNKSQLSGAHITPFIVLPDSKPQSPARSPTLPPEVLYNFEKRNSPPLGDADILEHHRANDEIPARFSSYSPNENEVDSSLASIPIARVLPSREDNHTTDQALLSNIERRNAATTGSTTHVVSVSVGRTGVERHSQTSVSPTIPPLHRHAFSRQSGSFPPNEARPSTSNSRFSVLSFYATSGAHEFSHGRPSSPLITPTPTLGHPPSRTPSPSFPYPPSDQAGSAPEHGESLARTRSVKAVAKNSLRGVQKHALQPFEPLLADELKIAEGDTLSVVQIFDDGWCVCVMGVDRGSEHDLGKSTVADDDDVQMGCIPMWVFERRPSMNAVHTRSMRSTSLAVTVDIVPGVQNPTPSTAAPPGVISPWLHQQQPIISWSNI